MRTFATVASELNYGRAASALHVSQPAVSQQIAQLERDVGVVLFERSRRGVRLTPAGQAFLPLCEQTLGSADAAVRAARNAQSSDEGIVRVAFAGAPSAPVVSALARAVRDRFPGIELQIHASLTSSRVMDQLAADELDLGFTADSRSVPGVETRLVSADQLDLAVAIDHPLAGRSSVRLADLAGTRFVLAAPAAGLRLREEAIEACIEAGFRPRIVQEAEDTQTVLALVAAGIGVTLIPKGLVGNAATAIALVPISDVRRSLRTVAGWRTVTGFGALQRVLDIVEEILPELADH